MLTQSIAIEANCEVASCLVSSVRTEGILLGQESRYNNTEHTTPSKCRPAAVTLANETYIYIYAQLIYAQLIYAHLIGGSY